MQTQGCPAVLHTACWLSLKVPQGRAQVGEALLPELLPVTAELRMHPC